MKIAVPTRNNVVDDHFGHCEYYTVFTFDENKELLNKEILPSPSGCGCKSNIAFVLKEIGVKVMLAGNMGQGALNVLNNQGIDVYRGCTGDVNDLVASYIKGEISDSGVGCKEHDDHHNGGHSHGHTCNH